MGLQQIADQDFLEPVDLEEAKNHLRVVDPDEDELIITYIQAAREWLEDYTHRALISRQFELTLAEFPIARRPIILPLGQLRSVERIQYVDQAAATQTLHDTASPMVSGNIQVNSSSNYNGEIVPARDTDWPTTDSDTINAVTVRYTAGYGANRLDVPATLRRAILYMSGNFFDVRDVTDEGGKADTARNFAAPYIVRLYP